MAENENKVERKNVSWKYSLGFHVMTATWPSGYSKDFNLSKIVNGCTPTQELAVYFGLKQWTMSLTADPKVYPTPEAKTLKIKELIDGVAEHGLELAGEGNIGVTGRVRANAGVAAENRQIAEKVKSAREGKSVKDVVGLYLLGFSIGSEEDAILKGEEAQKMLKALKEVYPPVKK